MLTLVIQAVLNALVVRVYGVDPQMERVRKKVEDEAGWGVVGGLILWKSIEVLIGLGAMELDRESFMLAFSRSTVAEDMAFPLREEHKLEWKGPPVRLDKVDKTTAPDHEPAGSHLKRSSCLISAHNMSPFTPTP